MDLSNQRSYSQSATNWRAIKKLYLQGAKKVYQPQPNRLREFNHEMTLNFEEIEQYIKPIIEQIDLFYMQKLSNLENHTNILLADLNNRLNEMEQQLRNLRQQKNKQIFVIKGRDSLLLDNYQVLSRYQSKEKSFIHIEQSQDQQSLLEDTEQKKPQYMNMEGTTSKKGSVMFKSSTNCRQLFKENDSNQKFMKYQFSENIYPLSTKQSTIFDQSTLSLREQVNNIRCLIEKAHDIKMEEFTQVVPGINDLQIEVSVKKIQIQGTKKEICHLKNENKQLRYITGKLRNQLQESMKQLQSIRMLLLKTINNGKISQL